MMKQERREKTLILIVVQNFKNYLFIIFWIHVFNPFLIPTKHKTKQKKDTNDALHYYKSGNANTTNGVLNITTVLKRNNYKAYNETTKKYYVDSKHVQSAMVQGWNKFCLTGGIVEFSAKLPGKSSVGGLWPACKSQN